MAPVKTEFRPPKTIVIKSDANEMEFQEVLPKSTHRKELMYIYKYTKSSTKLDKTIPLREQDIMEMKKRDTVKMEN